MSQSPEQIQKLCEDGARRLLARSVDDYRVSPEVLTVRVRSALQKYVLKDDAGASVQTIVEFVSGLQVDDLCLIVACESGDQRAWADLVERFSVTVRSAARAASANEEGAEDLAQSIWAELHGLRLREDGRPSGKLAYYSGRGSLAGWLRAVVAQLAVDQHRKISRLVQTEEDADFDRMISKGQGENEWSSPGVVNPELDISNKFAAADMQKALTRSIKQLSVEDRLLVKLYYFDGLKLKEAGAILGVHEATASRRLSKIHGELRRNVERVLIDQNRWTKAEAERAFSDIALRLEEDLEPLVTSEVGRLKKGTGAPLKS